jgi:predicted dienelactone hydrolase
MRSFLCALAGLLLSTGATMAAGFQRATVPDGDRPPLEVGIWYPSDAPTKTLPIETYRQTVAPDAPLTGTALPLILMSHGTGGSYAGHYDTALALAEAGFVVVALTHTADNWRDHSAVGHPNQFEDRQRHMSRVLDWMLGEWPGHDSLDRSKIGMFGFSAGGTTALLKIGGALDLARIRPHCAAVPADPVCQYVRKTDASAVSLPAGVPISGPDPRIRAAVIAAPALGFAFTPETLARIAIPVQLWRGDADEMLLQPWHAEAVHKSLPTGHQYNVVTNAAHYAFLAPCSDYLRDHYPDICADPAGFDRTAFHRTFNADVVAFFRAALAAG